jgi:hypothetical protein
LRDSVILKQQNEFNPVLDSSNYIKFKNYTLVNSIPNTKNRLSALLMNNKKNVFDMERNTSSCANFPLCKNTNQRANRKLNSAQLPTPTFRLNKNSTEKTCICKKNKCMNLGIYSKCKTRVCDC